MPLKSVSIQFRLLLAVAALATSTLIIGMASWYWLSRSNTILEELHNTTLNEVNRSHELTKQSALFTTSAPYLLNLRSSYLVQSEGNKLLRSIDATIESWKLRDAVLKDNVDYSTSVIITLAEMRNLIQALIEQSKILSEHDDNTRVHAAKLALMDNRLAEVLEHDLTAGHTDTTRQAQLAVHMLVTAANATSLLSLGEYQRSFLKLTNASIYQDGPIEVREVVTEAADLAAGPQGLFKTRFKGLQHNVSAHRLLGNISSKANDLNLKVLSLIRYSESEIAKRREETTASIQYAKILVALFGIGSIILSLISAFYISGYIIKRLNEITTTMTGLAEGDLNIGIPDDIHRNDELGALQKAFNIFHSNALDHNKVHTELIQKTALFESTFNNITDGVAITNGDGKLLACNPKLNQLLAHFGSKTEATIGCSLSQKVNVVSSKLRKSNQTTNDKAYKELRNPLGHVLEIRTSVLPDGGSVWLFSDTTERRRVEERLQHFQRLESLGQLTGEVAHDVNNVLSAVKATLPTVLSKRENESEHYLAVERIEDAVDMGNSLTQRLLAFAKKQRLDPKYVELNDLVNGVSELISLSLGSRIELKIVNSAKRLITFIDPLQLESSLLNLCMNSAHAIDENGHITIAVEQSKDNTLLIHVQDDGCGMNNETMIRAIEPFFSTRRASSGTGLGLSIVYGFVKQSGGDMQIRSAVGSGTTVTLSFQPSNEQAMLKPVDINNTSIGIKSVLVVEDDANTLELAAAMFQDAGYDVTKACSYDDASRILKSGSQFSLLFTDLHLGMGKTGWDIANACLRERLVERIIVTSGLLSDLSTPPAELRRKCKTLAKPYDLQDILRLA